MTIVAVLETDSSLSIAVVVVSSVVDGGVFEVEVTDVSSLKTL